MLPLGAMSRGSGVAVAWAGRLGRATGASTFCGRTLRRLAEGATAALLDDCGGAVGVGVLPVVAVVEGRVESHQFGVLPDAFTHLTGRPIP